MYWHFLFFKDIYIGCCSRFFYAQKAFVLLEYIFRKAEIE